MSGEYGAALVLTAAMGLVATLGRLWTGTWWSPMALPGLVWMILAAFPLVVAPDFPVKTAGYAMVFAFVAVGAVVSGLGHGASSFVAATLPHRDVAPKGRLVRWVYVVALGLGSIAPVAVFVAAAQAFGITDVATLAQVVTRARYEAGYVEPVIARALIASLYVASAAGGLAVGLGAIGPVFGAAWVVPMLAVAAVNTGRAGLIIAVVLWFAFVVLAFRATGRLERLRLRRIGHYAVLACAALVIVFGVTQLLRIGRFDSGALWAVLDRARVYFAAGLPTFGTWFADRPASHLGWGEQTFTALFEVLGRGEWVLGKYTEPVQLTPTQSGNIYTAWRPLIEDFGAIGAMLAWAVASAGASIAWGLARATPGVSTFVLAFFYPFVLFAPVTSIFTWTSVTVAIVACGALLLVPSLPRFVWLRRGSSDAAS